MAGAIIGRNDSGKVSVLDAAPHLGQTAVAAEVR